MCAELYGVGAAEPGQPEEQVRGNIRAPGSLKRKHVTPEYLDGYDAGTKCKGRDQNDLFKIVIEPTKGRQNCGLHEKRAYPRSDESRVGKERVRTCRSRW